MFNRKAELDWKEWIAIAFGLPASVLLLAKLDTNLDFSDYLRRAIINFESVSTYFWSIFGDYFNLDLTKVHGGLSIISLIMISYIFNVGKSDGEDLIFVFNFRNVFEIISMSILVTALAFSPSNFISFVFLTLIIFFIVLIFSATKYNSKILKHSLFGAIIVLLFIIIIISTMIFFSTDGDSIVPIIYGGVPAILIIFIEYVGLSKYILTKIVVMASGIYIIDFIGKIVRPAIDAFLNNAGA